MIFFKVLNQVRSEATCSILLFTPTQILEVNISVNDLTDSGLDYSSFIHMVLIKR